MVIYKNIYPTILSNSFHEYAFKPTLLESSTSPLVAEPNDTIAVMMM